MALHVVFPFLYWDSTLLKLEMLYHLDQFSSNSQSSDVPNPYAQREKKTQKIAKILSSIAEKKRRFCEVPK